MMRSIPPRLRTPLMMLVFGAVFAAAAVAGYGWGSLLHLGPVIAAGPTCITCGAEEIATLPR